MPYVWDSNRGDWKWVESAQPNQRTSADYTHTGGGKYIRNPRQTNYGAYTPSAYDRYMSKIFGPGGTQGYIKGQVQGASDVLSPYLNAMSSQGAASIGARGGLAGGAQDAYRSALTGQKTQALGQAATEAQRNVTGVGQNVLGMAQREGFQMTQDELNRFRAALEARGVEMNQQQLDFMTRDPGFWDYLNNILQGGASVAGAYYGGRR